MMLYVRICTDTVRIQLLMSKDPHFDGLIISTPSEASSQLDLEVSEGWWGYYSWISKTMG